MKTFLARLLTLFRRSKLDRDMAEEMRFHLEQRTAGNVSDGMPPDEARYAAQRTFGNLGSLQERAREQRGGLLLETLWKDLRLGVRLLGRAPGFALAAIASLALGIGVNTAMFSVVNELVLQPLPFAEADRLVAVELESRQNDVTRQSAGLGTVLDWQQRARTLETIAACDAAAMVVMTPEARRTSGLLTTPNLAEVLRVQPLLGRMFTAEETARREAVAVLSHQAWQTLHHARADILGQRIVVDGRPTGIVGVLPPGIAFPERDTELWVPHTFRQTATTPPPLRGIGPWRVYARLAPGSALAAAQAEITGITAALEREAPGTLPGLDARLTPLAERVVSRDLRTALALLLAAVGAVLLIACSNVGNLLLARGLARQREFALRLSLGATRGRLVRQLLVENGVLCLLAALLGFAFAWAALEGVRAFAPASLPRLAGVALDGRMLAFAFALSLVSACVFGLLPALRCTRRDPLAMMRDGARGSTETPRSRRLRGGLVVAEFALAVILLAGAGAVLRSFGHLLAVDVGFKTDNILLANLRLPANRPPPEAAAFAATVVERVAALPGVAAAAIGEEVLLSARGERTISTDAAPGQAAAAQLPFSDDAITPDYFRVMGVDLREGRFFTSADTANAPLVAIVNETLARRLWPDGSPLGRRLRIGNPATNPPWVTVVGVVADLRRQQRERAPIPQVFWPMAQLPSRAQTLLVQTQLAPAALAADVRRAVQSIDATVPVPTTTLEQQVDRGLAPRRFHTGLLAGFALLAFVLAGVGIFGLMHYAVARRTHEIGVRSALGASAAQILQQILREGLALAALGIALGLVGAVALLRVFSHLLYNVSPLDPLSLGAAATVLLALAALACYLPARRASRIDPLGALRCE